jgi:hypothetical protein
MTLSFGLPRANPLVNWASPVSNIPATNTIKIKH